MRSAAYIRVSTDEQLTDSQRLAITQYLNGADCTWYVDHGVSGNAKHKPELERLRAAVENGTYDRIVLYRLDRLSRNAIEAIQLLMLWAKQDIEVVFVDQPLLSAQQGDPFRITKLAMFAELAQVERVDLVRRTKAGLAAAKARGQKLGAPKKIRDEVRQQLRSDRNAGVAYRDLAKRYRISVAACHAICSENQGA